MRIAAIHYINSIPLIFGLRKNPDVQLRIDTPSACFRLLLNGEADLALIPVFGTQLHHQIYAVKGLGIAAHERTESVLLFSRKPLEKLRNIAADPASLTSVNLLRIILKSKYGIEPHIQTASSIKGELIPQSFDAALIIGDDAILNAKNGHALDVYDLASEWHSMTGFSFVFAVWASIKTPSAEEIQLLKASLDEGLSKMEEVIQEANRILPVDSDFLKRYYNQNLHYQLTPSDYKGLAAYLTLAADQKLIEKVRTELWI